MQVWAVAYDLALLSDDLYQKGLSLVDTESASRIKRFYRRQDASRTLIGRLLPRLMLKEQGISPAAMSFSATEANKPYITTTLVPPIAFNVTHDNGIVAMAFATGKHHAPAFSLGIDVMKVAVPARDTFLSFVSTMRSQLTSLEQRLLLSVPQDQGLRIFFWIWTMKEAYTKALGLGLGFDFQRVEYDVASDVVRVDDQGEDLYQGVVAEFLGEEVETKVIFETVVAPTWLHLYDAASIVERAIQDLQQ
ncbi:hypothetical protein C8J56DRAFT_1013992 [Mycena floridula]|nr:hypothetical protein C8J56DRAFT_1013992 [Mycena floridula]